MPRSIERSIGRLDEKYSSMEEGEGPGAQSCRTILISTLIDKRGVGLQERSFNRGGMVMDPEDSHDVRFGFWSQKSN